MALSITTSYAGTAALDYIAPAILEADTIAKGNITVVSNVKKSHKLQLASDSNSIQADSCDFAALGTVTITEKDLTPVKLKTNLEFCKSDMESTWGSEQLVAGALNTDLQPSFVDFITARTQKQVALGMDQLIWIGNLTGSTGIYASKPFLTTADGLVTKMKADGTVVKPAYTAITVSNVIAAIDKVYQAIPDTIFEAEDLKMFVSKDVYRAYGSAVPSQFASNSNYNITEKSPYFYKGVELVPTNLAASTIVATRVSNIFFGTDLLSDENEYKVIDLSETTGDNKLRIIMRYSGDVEFAYGAEVVLYVA